MIALTPPSTWEGIWDHHEIEYKKWRLRMQDTCISYACGLSLNRSWCGVDQNHCNKSPTRLTGELEFSNSIYALWSLMIYRTAVSTCRVIPIVTASPCTLKYVMMAYALTCYEFGMKWWCALGCVYTLHDMWAQCSQFSCRQINVCCIMESCAKHQTHGGMNQNQWFVRKHSPYRVIQLPCCRGCNLNTHAGPLWTQQGGTDGKFYFALDKHECPEK